VINPVLREFSISLQLTLTSSASTFLLTSVYGPSEDIDKPRFLEELLACAPATSIPWLCLGDFNLISDARDKNNNNIN